MLCRIPCCVLRLQRCGGSALVTTIEASGAASADKRNSLWQRSRATVLLGHSTVLKWRTFSFYSGDPYSGPDYYDEQEQINVKRSKPVRLADVKRATPVKGEAEHQKSSRTKSNQKNSKYLDETQSGIARQSKSARPTRRDNSKGLATQQQGLTFAKAVSLQDRGSPVKGNKGDDITEHTSSFYQENQDDSRVSVSGQQRNVEREIGKAVNLGLWWVQKMRLSAAKAKEKIMEKGYNEEITNQAIKRLQLMGFLDDVWFAEVTARHKWDYFKWSPRKIAQDLKMLGVAPHDITEALSVVLGSESSAINARRVIERDHQDLGDDKQGFDYQLLEALKRRLETMSHLPVLTQRRRLTSWLQYRSYSWDVISTMLSHLNLDGQTTDS